MKVLGDIWRRFASGITAGILVAIGGTVYLMCYNDGLDYSKYVGAFLFSIALLCVCLRGYSLYTGKIGFMLLNHDKQDFSVLLLGLFGNAVATIILGYCFAYALPEMKVAAQLICEAKLNQEYLSAFIRAIMCGILMYLAVDIYRENKSTLGIIFCVPTFILCGFEHSVANMFYFAASGIVSAKAFLYIVIIILGNSVGSLLIPMLKFKKKDLNSDIK